MSQILHLVCIGVPIYKRVLDDQENASLQQLTKVLGRYPIFFITHRDLNTEFYRTNFPSFGFRYFDPASFASMDGYNRLLLSREFYLAFQDFEFLMIYQTDAWVFRDELETWCRHGWDYVGAPWFDSAEPGQAPRMNQVGNGGFCLRRISTILRWFRVQQRFELLRELVRRDGTLPTALHYLRTSRLLGDQKGDYDVVARLFGGEASVMEDLFWSGGTFEEYKDGIRDLPVLFLLFLPWLFWFLRKPSAKKASRFSFEVHPRYLYQLYGNRLPFGCHAWAKWEPEFWREHIRLP